MSKAGLVITAVTVEKRPVADVARTYRVTWPWILTLLARYSSRPLSDLQVVCDRLDLTPDFPADVRDRAEVPG